MEPNSGLAFHVHHRSLFGWCYDMARRHAFIDQNKPEEERALRHKLLQWVDWPDVPADVRQAGAVYDQAGAVSHQAWAVYSRAAIAQVLACRVTLAQVEVAFRQAEVAYEQAEAACRQAEAACRNALLPHTATVERLHAEQCPNCPWDGQSIFPDKE